MEIDKKLKGLIEIPPTISMIESIRSVGYNFNTAVADLIDNSITAKSSKVRVIMEWDDGNPYLAILDNGDGMTEEMISQILF